VKNHRKPIVAAVAALAAIVVLAVAGTVLATPPTAPGFSGTTLAKATFGNLDIKAKTEIDSTEMRPQFWRAELKTNGDSDLYGSIARAIKEPKGAQP
jgi:hypothetical protein